MASSSNVLTLQEGYEEVSSALRASDLWPRFARVGRRRLRHWLGARLSAELWRARTALETDLAVVGRAEAQGVLCGYYSLLGEAVEVAEEVEKEEEARKKRSSLDGLEKRLQEGATLTAASPAKERADSGMGGDEDDDGDEDERIDGAWGGAVSRADPSYVLANLVSLTRMSAEMRALSQPAFFCAKCRLPLQPGAAFTSCYNCPYALCAGCSTMNLRCGGCLRDFVGYPRLRRTLKGILDELEKQSQQEKPNLKEEA